MNTLIIILLIIIIIGIIVGIVYISKKKALFLPVILFLQAEQWGVRIINIPIHSLYPNQSKNFSPCRRKPKFSQAMAIQMIQ